MSYDRKPPHDGPDKPLTEKQKKKVDAGIHHGTYMVYNVGPRAVRLLKNEMVGKCQLILQPTQQSYTQELMAMKQERSGDHSVEKPTKDVCLLSREWVIDNFQLKDNPVLTANTQVNEELIAVLRQSGDVFEGGAQRNQTIGQGAAGRTDWIVARVELKPGEENPVNMKQRAMNPEDSAQLSAQLRLWQEQDLIRPIDSEWNSALLSVAKKNTAA